MSDNPPIKEPGADYFTLAKSAEQCDRPNDALQFMKSFIELGQPLDEEARKLLQIVWKQVLGERRSVYKTLQVIMSDPANKSKEEITKKYVLKVEGDIKKICDDAQVSLILFLNEFGIIEHDRQPFTS